VVGCIAVPVADVPARNELGIGANRRPRPNIAATLALFVGRNIPLFAANKIPNLVALDALAGQVAESFVLIGRTSRAEINQELHDSRAMHTRHASRSAKRIALDQAGSYPSAVRGGKLVHEFNMLDRSGICKHLF
jgi:hypothetical protein